MGGTAVGAQLVVDATHQRVFGAHHHHVDGLVGHEGLDTLKVVYAHRHILTHLTGTGVAGGDKQSVALLALGDFPCQGMLASATS